MCLYSEPVGVCLESLDLTGGKPKDDRPPAAHGPALLHADLACVFRTETDHRVSIVVGLRHVGIIITGHVGWQVVSQVGLLNSGQSRLELDC